MRSAAVTLALTMAVLSACTAPQRSAASLLAGKEPGTIFYYSPDDCNLCKCEVLQRDTAGCGCSLINCSAPRSHVLSPTQRQPQRRLPTLGGTTAEDQF